MSRTNWKKYAEAGQRLEEGFCDGLETRRESYYDNSIVYAPIAQVAKKAREFRGDIPLIQVEVNRPGGSPAMMKVNRFEGNTAVVDFYGEERRVYATECRIIGARLVALE